MRDWQFTWIALACMVGTFAVTGVTVFVLDLVIALVRAIGIFVWGA